MVFEAGTAPTLYSNSKHWWLLILKVEQGDNFVVANSSFCFA